MDMVGGLLATTKGTFHLSRTAESLPHVVNEIARAWFDDVVARLGALRRGAAATRRRPRLAARLARGVPGRRPADSRWAATTRSSRRRASACRWSTSTTGPTSRSTRTRTSPKTSTRRSSAAWRTWAPASPGRSQRSRASRGLRRPYAYARAQAEARIALARGLVEGQPGRRRSRPARRLAVGIDACSDRSTASGRSTSAPFRRRRPPAARDAARARPTTARSVAQSRDPSALDVYYFSYSRRQRPGADPSRTALVAREDGDVLAYEAFNLVDGKRTVSEIRDVLTGRYEPVPLSEIAGVPRSAGEGRRRALRDKRASLNRRRGPQLRIAQIASIAFSVPPRSHGGTEIAIDLLTRGLVARGHDVTLFASGDSRTTAAASLGRSRRDAERPGVDVLPRARDRGAQRRRGLRAGRRASTSCTPTGRRPRPTSPTATERPSVLTCAYIEKALYDYYRAHYPNVHSVCVTRGPDPDARRRPAGHSLRRRRRARSRLAERRATSSSPSAAWCRTRAPTGRSRSQGGPACRSSSSGDVTPYLADSEPFYEERVRPHVDGERVRHFRALPNDEVLDARSRAPGPFSFPSRGRSPSASSWPRRWPPARRSSRRPAARCPSSSSTASRASSARPTRSSPASSPRVSEIDRAACRRRAEERYGSERMVSDYEAFYRKILG